MSIGAKQNYLREAEKHLGLILTADMLVRTMSVLTETMDGYDMEQSKAQDADTDLLDAFTAAKLVEGRSSKTIERYTYVIKRFLEDTKTTTRMVTVYHIRTYFMNEKDRGISYSTLEGIRCVLSSYFGWLQKEGLLEKNPCANLGSIKCEKVVRHPYNSEDLERLRESCKTVRDRAIIEFLLSTGCRISEVCGLNRDDIRFDVMECTVLGKGNKERIVYLDPVTVLFLKRYLSTRKDDHEALFIGKRNERLLPGGVRMMLKQMEKKTGVPNIHPHRFRRTLATSLISRGMAIQEVASVLGHDRIDTTMKYVCLDKTMVKNSYRKYAS